MNFKEMRDYVQQTLGLQDITSYDETGLVATMLHQGAIDMLARTKCVARCVGLRTLAGVSTYTLDHEVLAIVDIENGSIPKARRDQGSWAPAFTLIKSDVLRVSPTPTENGELQVWAVKRPDPMVNDTDTLDGESFGAIPTEFQDAVPLYALWKCSDYADDQTAQQGERYRMLYEGQDGRGGRLGQIRSAVNRRGTARAPHRRVRLRPVSSSGYYT